MDAATAEMKAAKRMDDGENTTVRTLKPQVVTDIAIIDALKPEGSADIVPFDFEELDVRVLDRNGTPWFILADVCRVLELKNPSMTAKSLDDDEVATIDTKTLVGVTDPRAQQVRVISESGLYSLIMTSQKPQAQRFRKWVTAIVLPSLRRTGSYRTAPAADVMEALNDPATMRALLLSMKAKAVVET
jgi:prophage antirepressor-like protein